MFAAVTSAALVGVAARPVRVEVHVSGRKDVIAIVGLPDAAIREARERVRSAIHASGHRFPGRRITVNLAPADLPKVGSAYDLPIALGVLVASGFIPPRAAEVVALGELALDGEVRPTRGGLAAGMVAARRGVRCLVAVDGSGEAALSGAEVHGVSSLAEAIAVACGDRAGSVTAASSDSRAPAIDLASVRGQTRARRALEIAAAGGHHLLLKGPPGAGKTMLARALPGILPDLTTREALEVAQAHGAAGRAVVFDRRPPFRCPHHSATPAAILGGGSGVPVPGELTLADHGVLFLDELAEFPQHLLDMLRQPIEEGRVHIARKGISVTFPCRAQLVAATNPCPCGYEGDRRATCTCSERAKQRYANRLSGPLLDRFDLRVPVPRVDGIELRADGGEESAVVRHRVERARGIQRERGIANRALDRDRLDTLPWGPEAVDMLEKAVDAGKLTGRGWDRVRRVARTIADLAGEETVARQHVVEALMLRGA